MSCEPVIERAWDEREPIGPETKGEVRQAVDAAIAALDSGEARDRREARRRVDGQPMAEEGRAAVVPPQPDGS